MKKETGLLMALMMILQLAQAQKGTGRLYEYRNFPLVVGIQFHSISKPFKNLKQNFANVGFTLGTEIALGSKHNWAQSFQLGWYHNKTTGNGFMVYTQSVYRPYLLGNSFAEVKAGVGWMHSAHPVSTQTFTKGNWTVTGKTGKGMLMIPVGVSLGYNAYSNGTYVAPSISYQAFVSGPFNKGIPVMLNTVIQAGTRIHLKK